MDVEIIVKATLVYRDETSDDRKLSRKVIYASNEDEFWEKYYENKDYVKFEIVSTEEESEYAYSFYLKKDRIVEIWIEDWMEF